MFCLTPTSNQCSLFRTQSKPLTTRRETASARRTCSITSEQPSRVSVISLSKSTTRILTRRSNRRPKLNLSRKLLIASKQVSRSMWQVTLKPRRAAMLRVRAKSKRSTKKEARHPCRTQRQRKLWSSSTTSSRSQAANMWTHLARPLKVRTPPASAELDSRLPNHSPLSISSKSFCHGRFCWQAQNSNQS